MRLQAIQLLQKVLPYCRPKTDMALNRIGLLLNYGILVGTTESQKGISGETKSWLKLVHVLILTAISATRYLSFRTLISTRMCTERGKNVFYSCEIIALLLYSSPVKSMLDTIPHLVWPGEEYVYPCIEDTPQTEASEFLLSTFNPNNAVNCR